MTIEKNSRTQRYHDLDFVRATAMLLGLLLHVCIFFMPSHKYFWGTGEYFGDVLDLQFLNFIHLFRMQLFFFMAGFFAELVIDRKGLHHLVNDRLKRIVLPFIIGLVLLMPLHFLLVGKGGYYVTTMDGLTLMEKLKSILFFGVLDPDVSLQDSLIHLWFIFYLIIFYVVHLSLRPLIRFPLIQKLCNWQPLIDFAVSHKWGFLLLGVLTFPLQYLLKSAFLPPTGFNVPIVDLALYFVFYLFGVAFYRQRYLLAKLGDNAWYYLAFSVPFFILIDEPTERLDQSASVVSSITNWTFIDLGASSFASPAVWYEGIFHNGYHKVLIVLSRSMLCWSMCFAFIGLTHRYLSQPRKSIRYLADSAYWVYWVHLPITFKLSYMAQSIEGLNALTKSYIVLVFSSLLIFASYHWGVRYTWLGDYFMGCRKSRTDPNELQFKFAAFCKKVMVPAVSIGLLIFCFGSLLQYNNEFRRPQVLVEAYVARQQSTLDAVDSIDGISDRYGNTPLHAAAKMPEGKRRYDTMPVLLSKCSNPNIQNDFGRTALFTAVKSGNTGDIEQLLDAGADINIGDRYGHTPAHAAAILAGNRNAKLSDSYFAILQILIQNGADLSVTDYRDRTVQDCLQMFSGRKLEPALSSESADSVSQL
ncbi:acyltransferase family protein [bacterium]|nr:acyltransferase family protein [bacterium]